jgi:DNA polymerase
MLISIDIETAFDKNYTLKKMTTTEYLRDERFRVLGFAIKRDDQPAIWVPEDRVERTLALLKPTIEANTLMAFHAHFDMAILAWHYGIRPKFRLDPMLMAKALGHKHVGLGQLASKYDLGFKTELSETSSEAELATRGTTDVELMYKLFAKLMPGFPRSELRLIDLTIRWYTDPAFVANRPLLQKLIKKIEARNQKMLDDLGIEKGDLASAAKFQALLEGEGVEIEYKAGKKGKQPCFAKTDEFMKRLVDHENETVADLAAARLGIKSTGELTRAQRFLEYSARGPIPVYLSYYGAHPGRWSGADGVNFQNFKRGGEIREAIGAPKGHKIIAGDLAQIECRGTAWLAGQSDLLDGFREQRDVYSEFATEVFGIPVSKAQEFERFCGKFVVLGSGYGMGEDKCFAQIRAEIRKRALPYAPPSEKVCAKLIDTYRQKYTHIVALWGEIRHKMLMNPGYTLGPLVAEADAVLLPNGLRLHYPDLRRTKKGFEYWGREGITTLWGGKALQNFMEALCRLIISDQMLELDRMGWQTISSTHDEIVMMVKDDDVDEARQDMEDVMTGLLPKWADGIPLAVEIGVGQTYGAC